jgi:hypothetical protein
MKRIQPHFLHLALGLVAIVLPGMGLAWDRLGETEEVVLYLHRPSIAQEGNVQRVWEMQDLKKADKDGVMSRRYVNEYECKERMHRIGRVTSYAGPKLSGKKVFEVEEFGYWRKVPPDGLFAVVFIWLCVK